MSARTIRCGSSTPSLTDWTLRRRGFCGSRRRRWGVPATRLAGLSTPRLSISRPLIDGIVMEPRRCCWKGTGWAGQRRAVAGLAVSAADRRKTTSALPEGSVGSWLASRRSPEAASGLPKGVGAMPKTVSWRAPAPRSRGNPPAGFIRPCEPQGLLLFDAFNPDDAVAGVFIDPNVRLKLLLFRLERLERVHIWE